MLGEYKLTRCTRQCYIQKRPLREGEYYYSVIVEAGDDFERRDYSAEAWEGPPENAIGHWKLRIPKSDEKKLVVAPKEVLINLLREMEHVPEKRKARYLLALMMLRRRMVRPAPADSSTSPEVLQIQVIEDDSIISVPACEVGRSESETLLEELNTLLYCDADAVTELESEET